MKLLLGRKNQKWLLKSMKAMKKLKFLNKIVQEKSEELLDQKKARKFQEIFILLDSDNDGTISAEKIDISILSPKILDIFTPLFCEMEELGQSLDVEEFIDASMRLYETLKLPEKNLILSLKKQMGSRETRLFRRIHIPSKFKQKFFANC
jgi:5S rRNA maturation endonuclease (ribonuclease M5)